MKMQWQKVLVKTTVWLVAEVLLNLLGLDDLADYSEFIFERHLIVTNCLTLSVTSQLPGYFRIATMNSLGRVSRKTSSEPVASAEGGI